MSSARKRLMIDHRKLRQNAPEGIDACPINEDFMTWTCIISGPEDTIWDGGPRPAD